MNNNEEQKLFDKIHSFKYDPLGFVRYAFPWGEKGTILENASIDPVETEILSTLGKACQDNINTRNAIQMAVASGNGIGKSSIAAWVIIWFMSTRETPQIVVTANTKTQLETKTWRELSKWHKMAINKHWFTWTATKFYAVDSPSNWFAAAIPQNENNPEAFSGTHEKNVLTLVDEASALPDVIWEMNDGSMTTPGAMRLVCGNPTKNTGRFFECFNRFKSRWITKQIDSRDSTLTNKEELQNWIDDYGEDSDYVRVHVKGIFPRFSMNQLISEEMVNRAIKRDNKPEEYRYEPIILGVDVARMGDDQSVICVRQGNKVHELRKVRGLDGAQVANEVLIVEREYHRLARDIFIFLDVVGIGASAYDALVRLSKSNVFPVNAGIKASDSKRFFNKRIEMWWDMKEWLDLVGQIPDDKELTIDLTAPTYGYANKTEQFQLEGKKEMKGRGLASPDSGDSLAHTFFIKISLDNYNSIDYSDDDEYGYNDNNRTSTPYTGY